MKELGSRQSLDFNYNIGSPLVSSLTVHPEDFGLPSLHNYMSQFLFIFKARILMCPVQIPMPHSLLLQKAGHCD